jgi:hypothetical protein
MRSRPETPHIDHSLSKCPALLFEGKIIAVQQDATAAHPFIAHIIFAYIANGQEIYGIFKEIRYSNSFTEVPII